MIRVDGKKCNRCGICVDLCPAFIFSLESVSKDAAAVDNPDRCISCGHCVAVCPRDAIVHDDYPLEVLSRQKKNTITPESLQNLIHLRRSIRCYRDKEVPDRIVDMLVDAGVHAGTGSNLQSVEFAIIRDRDLLDKLETAVIDIIWNSGIKYMKGNGLLLKLMTRRYGSDLISRYRNYYSLMKQKRETGKPERWVFRNAPIVIVSHGMRMNNMDGINSALAMRNMELLAQTLGLGTCWAGFLISAAQRKPRLINSLLGIGSSRLVYGALMAGYPKYTYRYDIPRRSRNVVYI